jgi:hypothetical protein
MMELSIKMFTEMGTEWDESPNEEKQGFAHSLFSEVVFDLDTHCITSFKLKPRVEPFLQVQVSRGACLEGFRNTTAPLPSADQAVQYILALLYGDAKAVWQTWEKRERNAEILRRYENGEDSVVLAQAFSLGDRRIRDIIEHERKHKGR